MPYLFICLFQTGPDLKQLNSHFFMILWLFIPVTQFTLILLEPLLVLLHVLYDFVLFDSHVQVDLLQVCQFIGYLLVFFGCHCVVLLQFWAGNGVLSHLFHSAGQIFSQAIQLCFLFSMLLLHFSSQKFTVFDGILKFISDILFFLEGALEWYYLLLHAADDTNVLVLVHIGELAAALLLFEGVVFSP